MRYQVAIIGGGPAGYTAAEAAGKAGLSVVLFEKQNLGGVCLNEGCIPTKTLLYSAKTYDSARHASKYAVTVPEASFDLPKIVARKQKVVRKLVLGIKAKLTGVGVNIVTGEASVVDAHRVACGGEEYECDNLLLCTGSETFVPPIAGLDKVPYWTHREALDNKELPASLAIIGGGVIGMEFASFFCSLGTQVTVVEMMDEILGGMDRELSAMLRADYAKRGVRFLLSTKVVSVDEVDEDGQRRVRVGYEDANGAGSVVADKLLMSVGRRPVRTGFGLENLDVARDGRGNVVVDEHMQLLAAGPYGGARGRGGCGPHCGTRRPHELPCHPRRGLHQSRDSRCGRDRGEPQTQGHGVQGAEVAYGLFGPLCGRKRRRERRVQAAACAGWTRAGRTRAGQPRFRNHHAGRHGRRAGAYCRRMEKDSLPASHGSRNLP